jgi:hypothetical protein
VSTDALICLGQPRTRSSVPSLREWRADASHERLGARKRLSPATQSLCRPPSTRNTVQERLPVLCVYLARACSLAGDVGRQPWLVLSGIAKGEVAGGTGECPASLSTRNSIVAETQRIARDEFEDCH